MIIKPIRFRENGKKNHIQNVQMKNGYHLNCEVVKKIMDD